MNSEFPGLIGPISYTAITRSFDVSQHLQEARRQHSSFVAFVRCREIYGTYLVARYGAWPKFATGMGKTKKATEREFSGTPNSEYWEST